MAILKQAAEGYKEEVILRSQGDVARYLALLKPYLQAPAVTRDRLYYETVSDVLSHTHDILVDAGGNNVLYLPLSQMMRGQLPPLNISKQGSTVDVAGKNDIDSVTANNPGLSNMKSNDTTYGAGLGYSAKENN